jgi:DNA-binding IscR family transcriptional regulator
MSAKADYAVRTLVELAAAPVGEAVNSECLAASQGISQDFLHNTLSDGRANG